MPQERLTGHQKLGFAIVVVIGLATFVLGFVQLRKSVLLPFVKDSSVTLKSADTVARENEQRMKSQDTDQDGLNDYDEQYVFRTSPYLEDSDSDGDSDSTEVSANTDPNCPKGKECRQARVGSSGTSGSTASASGTGTADTGAAPDTSTQTQTDAYQAILEVFGDPTTLTSAQITAKVDAMSSTDLRAFLKRMGIPESAIQKADDDTLKTLLKDTLIELIST